MPTEILSFTIMTLWPVVLAAFVWLIATQSAKEDDENEKIVGILPRSPQLEARDNNRRGELHAGLRRNVMAKGRVGDMKAASEHICAFDGR